ncbi:hypothetical protein Purlil1_12011 [Purpureocillium lilacinum]|uniref:Uncharacterized protein n=1 Tax=Purpureocillium lilacinum TaxID=33203 RepID=A0ABR0BHX5_PURLI|nr:hypothetical protein Purlil1_12011 [Purpureocillium lilacinum]
MIPSVVLALLGRYVCTGVRPPFHVSTDLIGEAKEGRRCDVDAESAWALGAPHDVLVTGTICPSSRKHAPPTAHACRSPTTRLPDPAIGHWPGELVLVIPVMVCASRPAPPQKAMPLTALGRAGQPATPASPGAPELDDTIPMFMGPS